jgi:hypothetical protein
VLVETLGVLAVHGFEGVELDSVEAGQERGREWVP